MKKLLALLLTLLLLLVLVACGEEEAPAESHDHSHESAPLPTDTEAPSTEPIETHDHNHINYKGLSSKSYSLEDIIAAEGEEPAFSFDANGVTYYAYNSVTLDNLLFTQVQHSFMEDYNRVSCTSSGDSDPQSTFAQWENAMTELYGEPLTSDNGLLRWLDHTNNYVTLTQLNEDTVQLCFYFVA